MKAFIENEKGTIIVLVAVIMSVLIGFMALVVDAGSLYLEKNRLQKISDAAALAGIQNFPTNYLKTKEEINKTILMNEGNPEHFTVNTNSGFTYLEVVGKKKVNLFFAKVVGIKDLLIEARARLDLFPISSGKGAVPIGLQPTGNLSFGALQTLLVTDSTNGNYGAIALSGPGASNYEMDFTNGYQSELTVGTILNTESGRMSGPTENAVNARIGACPNATYLNFPPDCARVVLVPIVEPVGSSSNIKQVQVVGFATLFIEGSSTYNNNAAVTGRFIRKVQPGKTVPGQANYGTYSFKFTQ